MLRAFVIFLIGAIAARADVEFVGVSSGSEGSLFVVSDSATKSISSWLKIGDSFEGAVIASYDKNAEILDVRSGEQTLHLKLRPSVVTADHRPRIDIIGPAPAPEGDHLNVPHIKVRIVNDSDRSLYYTANGREGIIVNTETKFEKIWISSSTVITGFGWNRYALPPGSAVEASVPFLRPMHHPKDAPPQDQCPTRFCFPCSTTQEGEDDVSCYSRECAPGEFASK
jgi:hypothetical protein